MLLHSRDDTASSVSGPMGPLVLRVFKRAKIFVRLLPPLYFGFSPRLTLKVSRFYFLSVPIVTRANTTALR